jgi:hypothetical protein
MPGTGTRPLNLHVLSWTSREWPEAPDEQTKRAVARMLLGRAATRARKEVRIAISSACAGRLVSAGKPARSGER